MKWNLLLVAVAVTALAGCRSWCNKRACNSCPPPGAIYSGGPVAPVPQGEIMFPSAPPTSAPIPLAPGGPAPPPNASGYGPLPPLPNASGYSPLPPLPANGGIANVPGPAGTIQLDKPEFSETKQTGVTTLKPVVATTTTAAGPRFTEVEANKLATGGRPNLDDLDRLHQAGYRYLLDVGASAGTASTAEKQVFASRGLQLLAANNGTLQAGTYVFSDDAPTLAIWWTAHFRTAEHLSSDAAAVRAARLVAGR